MLTSIKHPVEANARIPKIIGFAATADNYTELWLNMPAKQFAPYGIGLLVLFAILIVVGVLSKNWRVSRPAVAAGIVLVLVGALLILPRVANMAEFYGYFLSSVIVTVGTLVVSSASAAWPAMGWRVIAVSWGLSSWWRRSAFARCPGWLSSCPTTSWARCRACTTPTCC